MNVVQKQTNQLEIVSRNNRPSDMESAMRWLRGNASAAMQYGLIDKDDRVYDLLKVRTTYEDEHKNVREDLQKYRIYIPMIGEPDTAYRQAVMIRAARQSFDWVERMKQGGEL